MEQEEQGIWQRSDFVQRCVVTEKFSTFGYSLRGREHSECRHHHGLTGLLCVIMEQGRWLVGKKKRKNNKQFHFLAWGFEINACDSCVCFLTFLWKSRVAPALFTLPKGSQISRMFYRALKIPNNFSLYLKENISWLESTGVKPFLHTADLGSIAGTTWTPKHQEKNPKHRAGSKPAGVAQHPHEPPEVFLLPPKVWSSFRIDISCRLIISNFIWSY